MKKIIYSLPDGRVAVVHPVINTHPEPEKITENEALERAIARLPAGVVFQVVDETSIPSDRTFRDGWKEGAGKVEHDMVKCREIHRGRMRIARAPKLAALDVEQLRGRNVEAEKQALRDVTADPRIDSATTPEELKAVWPEVLN